jgi:hypothetical protein
VLFRRYGIVSGLALLLAACGQAATGTVQVAMPAWRFAVQAIPAATAVIRIGCQGAGDFHRQGSLTATASSVVWAGIPVGQVRVAAVAFDAQGVPLAGGIGLETVRAQARTSVRITLAEGPVPTDWLVMVGMTEASPSASPSAQPSASPTMLGPSAEPSGPTSPLPTAGPSPAPTATPVPVVEPVVPAPPAGGGGALATPSPVPGGVQVLPGNSYAGPVIFQP